MDDIKQPVDEPQTTVEIQNKESPQRRVAQKAKNNMSRWIQTLTNLMNT